MVVLIPVSILKRVIKEILCFPLLVLTVTSTPLLLLGFWSSKQIIRKEHEKIKTLLGQNKNLAPLLELANGRHVRFTFQREKSEIGFRWNVTGPQAPRKHEGILARRYTEFLYEHFDEGTKHPLMYIQVDRKTGAVLPQDVKMQLWALSHELGHLESWTSQETQCDQIGKNNVCAMLEICADLRGLEILKRLGYNSQLIEEVYTEFIFGNELMRAPDCVFNIPSCREKIREIGIVITTTNPETTEVSFDWEGLKTNLKKTIRHT